MGEWRTRGQPVALEAVTRMASREHVPHALLLVGPSGGGKTTLALDLAAALLCAALDPAGRPCRQCAACRRVDHGNHPDLHRLVPWGAGRQVRIGDRLAPEPGTVRSLIRELSLAPSEGGWRIAIVEEADRLNEDAQNALLKLLEEPPGRTLLVLCAADEDRLLPTVRSRCVRVRLGPVAADTIAAMLVERGAADASRAAALARRSRGRPGVAFALAASPDTVLRQQGVERELLDLARKTPAERLAASSELFRSADQLAALLVTAQSPGAAAATPPGTSGPSRSSGASDGIAADDEAAPPKADTASSSARGGRSRGRREATDEASGDGTRDRQAPAARRAALLALGDTWRAIARDLALASRGARAELAHVDLLEELVALSSALQPGAAERFLVRLDTVLDAAERNANPEIALDVLLLAWPAAHAA